MTKKIVILLVSWVKINLSWNCFEFRSSKQIWKLLNTIITENVCRETLVRIDINDLKAFTKHFEYFVEETELLSTEKGSTISLVVPLKQRLIKLSQEDGTDSQSMKNFRKYIQKYFYIIGKFIVFILLPLYCTRNLSI